jgi:hypothetical protein
VASGTTSEPLKRDILRVADITDLFELAQGKRPGRTNDREITSLSRVAAGMKTLPPH